MRDQRLVKLADVLVNYSTKVKPGERVFIRGESVTEPLLAELARKVIEAGAHPEILVELPDVMECLLREGNAEQIETPSLCFQTMAEKADVMLYVWGSANLKANSRIDPAKLGQRRKARSKAGELMDEREARGEFRWCGTQFPTQADAQEAEMSLTEFEEFVYGAGMIDRENPAEEWEKIGREQQRWVRYLNGKKELHYRAKGTDIRVSVAGRNWISCAGEANFPDGEIFTSPVEDSMNGVVHFTYPAVYGGREVEGVTLTVKDGKIVEATATKGEEYLRAMLDIDERARYFGEVAIGTNYGIRTFSKNILFDEKIGGTMHMAAGNSIPGTGGKNISALHWDFICDMSEGEITADGEVFYRNGQFLINVLD